MTAKAIARIALLCAAAAGCTAIPTRDDPYPGAGGKPFADPDQSMFCSGAREFDPGRFSSFRLGVSNKQDVVKALGEPTWWASADTGASVLGYDFYRKTPTCQFPNITPATFEFDAGRTLVDVDYPGSLKAFPQNVGPESNIVVHAHFGMPSEMLFIDGITPATKPNEIYLGGFFRTRLSVDDTLYGAPHGRAFVVTLLAGDAGRIKGYDELVLLKRDRFGIVRVAGWGFCIDGQVAEELGIDSASLSRIDSRYRCRTDRRD